MVIALILAPRFSETAKINQLRDRIVGPITKSRDIWMNKDANCPSFIHQIVENGQVKIAKTGVEHDYVVLVNPLISDEKVLLTDEAVKDLASPVIPKEGFPFFYRDQLKKLDVPVYRVKPGARSHFGEPIGRVQQSEEWRNPEEKIIYLINPSSGDGGEKIYLDDWHSPKAEVGAEPEKKYFFWRWDVELLNP